MNSNENVLFYLSPHCELGSYILKIIRLKLSNICLNDTIFMTEYCPEKSYYVIRLQKTFPTNCKSFLI